MTQAFLVSETDAGYSGAWTEVHDTALADEEVRIKVEYSSLNFKDALSYSGNKGVTRSYPHVPGIDASGVILESSSDAFKVGDAVLVTGYDLGMNTNGGFSETIQVPASWVIQRPSGLSSLGSMILGTAGLTAGLCVQKLLRNGLKPEHGSVLVSGASGGVGSIACKLLAKLGFEVTAVLRDQSKADFFKTLGVTRFIDMDELMEGEKKPMLKPKFAAALDVAGGSVLAAILKQIMPSGSVATCGLVDSPSVKTSVFPFILRGVNLLGVDSVEIPPQEKQAIWNLFAKDWSIDAAYQIIDRTDLKNYLEDILQGKAKGRYVLKLG